MNLSNVRYAGKGLHKALNWVSGRGRSLALVNWYRLSWQFGGRCNLDGRIRRRAFGGDARFGRSCDLGHNLVIDVATGGELIVGSNVSINGGTYISVRSRIHIGDDTRIGEYASIRDNDHIFEDPTLPVRQQGMTTAPISIGRDVWIGRNACIQPGVTIGDGAIIGANAFVNKNVPAFAIAAGLPARIIGSRNAQRGT